MGLNVNAFLNTVTPRLRSLPVVILYVTEECNLQCITCSYRKALPGELSLEEITEVAARLHGFGLKHVAFSGGEPLMRRDFPSICDAFRRHGVRQTLLTNGLLLEKRLPEVAPFLSEIIVSLDGADGETHNAIRGAIVFDRIVAGIRRAVKETTGTRVSLRTVVQKRNFRQIPAIISLAHELGVHQTSFLAADMASDAFGREGNPGPMNGPCVTLDPDETVEFAQLVEDMSRTHAEDFRTKFIVQSPAGLRHVAAYFAALQGAGPFPQNRCNAPMVSAVITSTGEVKPCFFLPEMGNIRTTDLDAMLNSSSARATRAGVRRCSPEQCKKCVCTLRVSRSSALFDRF